MNIDNLRLRKPEGLNHTQWLIPFYDSVSEHDDLIALGN